MKAFRDIWGDEVELTNFGTTVELRCRSRHGEPPESMVLNKEMAKELSEALAEWVNEQEKEGGAK